MLYDVENIIARRGRKLDLLVYKGMRGFPREIDVQELVIKYLYRHCRIEKKNVQELIVKDMKR